MSIAVEEEEEEKKSQPLAIEDTLLLICDQYPGLHLRMTEFQAASLDKTVSKHS